MFSSVLYTVNSISISFGLLVEQNMQLVIVTLVLDCCYGDFQSFLTLLGTLICFLSMKGPALNIKFNGNYVKFQNFNFHLIAIGLSFFVNIIEVEHNFLKDTKPCLISVISTAITG